MKSILTFIELIVDMKTLKICLLLIVPLLFVQCSDSAAPEVSMHRSEYRGQTISLLLSDKGYLGELQDSIMKNPSAQMAIMKSKHPMMEMLNDSSIVFSLMDQIMTAAEKDSIMREQMIHKMMEKPHFKLQLEKIVSREPVVVQDNLDHNKHHSPIK